MKIAEAYSEDGIVLKFFSVQSITLFLQDWSIIFWKLIQFINDPFHKSFMDKLCSRETIYHWFCYALQGLEEAEFIPISPCINPQMPKVFRQPKTPKGGWMQPPGFLPSRPNFLKIFLMGMFSGSRNPTVIMKKFYLYCMTLKIKVKHLFAWPFLSPVVHMIQSRSWCRF